MKIFTKIIILMSALLIVYGCQDENILNLGNGLDNITTPPDSGDNGSEVDPDNPENPDPSLPPIAENTDDGIEETVEIDSGKSKIAGNGSYISSGKTGFNDINLGSDIAKPIDVNTTGTIQANISFMQSHNVAQNGNSINSKPELTAHKDALILVTTNTFYKSMEAVIVTGSKTAVIKLDPPHQIPEVDSTRPDKTGVAFSNRAWSGLIPAKYMKNGMKVTINAVNASDAVLTDTLKREQIDFESPVEATIYLTRIGLLEELSAYSATDNYLVNNSAKAVAEYFQTVPFAKIIYSQYDDVRIYNAMKSNGELITSLNGNTSLYNDIILNQIGAGIQLANKGNAHSDINAGAYQDRDPLYIVLNQTSTSRPSVTDYKGIISIFNTSGSQFSRYMGYVYGLTDNVDLDKGVVDGSVHNYNTGWGYDSYKNRMRGNLAWNDNGSSIEFGGKTIAGFKNTYGWQKDPMSMGEAVDNSTISKYPYHTARAADSIQEKTGKRYMLDDAKVDGKHRYLYWDRKDDVYKYTTDEAFLASRIFPTEKGVPVYTIIGLYNKENSTQGIIYPAFKANYGNVFGDLFVSNKPSGNMLEITYQDGSTKYVNLDVTDNSSMRRFHINIPQADNPEKVTLFINGTSHSSITINNQNSNTKEPVIIGKSNGYETVIDADIKELQTILNSYTVDNFIINDRAEEIISSLNFNKRIDNITDYNTLNIVKKFNDNRNNLNTLKAFIEENRTSLNNGDNDTTNALKEKAVELGYDVPKTVVYIGQQIKMKLRPTFCFEPQMVNGKMQAKEVQCVENRTEQLWYMDNDNRIHSIVRPDLCLNNNMDADGVKKCTYGNYTVWNRATDYGEKVVYKTTNNRCLDSWNYKLFPSHACQGHEYQEMEEAFHKKTRSDRYESTPAVFSNNHCINIADNNTITVEACSSAETNENYKLFTDLDGRIHVAKKPNYCLEGFTNGVKLMPCSSNSRQKWIKKNINAYENVSYSGKCLSDNGNGGLVLSACQGNNQQTFTNELAKDTNKGISYFDEALLKEFDKYIIQEPAVNNN